MPRHPSEANRNPPSLTDDEIAVIQFFRALQIDRDEGLRRLASPSLAPIMPQIQELQSNLSAVIQDLLPPDPTADCPTQR